MIDKAQGLVLCTHCSAQQADETCPSCGHVVCSACAVDASRCPDHRPQRIQLGRFSRVLHVDAAGAHALVANLLGTCSVYDLRQQKLRDEPRFGSGARGRYRRGERRPRSCVLPSGQVAHIQANNSRGVRGQDVGAYNRGANVSVDGIRVRTPGSKDRLYKGSGDFAASAWVVPGGVFDADGQYVYHICQAPRGYPRSSRRQNTVDVVDLHEERLVGTIAPELRITAAAACGQTRLLALALAEPDEADGVRVQLYSLESLQPRGEALRLPDRVDWIGLGGSKLAAKVWVRAEDRWDLELRDLPLLGCDDASDTSDTSDTSDAVLQRLPATLNKALCLDQVRGPLEASLARSGAYLALRHGPGQVALVNLLEGTQQLLEVRMKEIDVVRFVDQDRRLAVAGSEVVVFHFRRGQILT